MTKPSQPALQQHVLIVAHGRSGSTLLQGLLNTIPGWHIRGENQNFTFSLFQSYSMLLKTKTTHSGNKASSPTSPWYGSKTIDLDAYQQKLREAIQEVLVSDVDLEFTKCAGFKEIRYLKVLRNDPSGDTLSAFLDFLHTTLNPCKLIFLNRDPVATSKSGWWDNQDPAAVQRKLTEFQEFCTDYCARNPEISFEISYDDIVERRQRLYEMADFLGVHFQTESLERVLGTPHSFNQKNLQKRADAEDRKLELKKLIESANEHYVEGNLLEARKLYSEHCTKSASYGVPVSGVAAARAEDSFYKVRYSKAYRLAYFPIPKVACTSVTHLLFELLFGRPATGNPHGFFNQNMPPVKDLEQFDDFYKFVVVRDPVARFVSGFRNKVVDPMDPSAPHEYVQKYNLPTDINAFVDDLDAILRRVPFIEHHMASQSGKIHHDLSIFDDVVPIEQLDDLVGRLSERVGRPLSLGHMQTDGAPIKLHDLSAASVEKLIDFFAEDYRLLSEYYDADDVRERHAAG